jgi:hypothetical protein
VSDYRLGNGATGVEAIARVVDYQRTVFGEEFPLPAIVISGDTSQAELQQVAATGYRMLHKPVACEDLHAALNAELARLLSRQSAGNDAAR